jgi:hypothetical protein
MANFLLILFLNFFPKNEWLYISLYCFAAGSLQVAVGAFKNQMVFHSLDNMSSLALHLFPTILLYNLQWNTMPYEKTLPESER